MSRSWVSNAAPPTDQTVRAGASTFQDDTTQDDDQTIQPGKRPLLPRPASNDPTRSVEDEQTLQRERALPAAQAVPEQQRLVQDEQTIQSGRPRPLAAGSSIMSQPMMSQRPVMAVGQTSSQIMGFPDDGATLVASSAPSSRPAVSAPLDDGATIGAVPSNVHTNRPPPESEPEAGQLRSGATIKNVYEVKELLGEGGMGAVYRVFHRVWRRDLVIKAPKAGVVDFDVFKKECEAWTRLGMHPNIVTAYVVFQERGALYVVAELVDGSDLKHAIVGGSLYAGSPGEVKAAVLDAAIQVAWGIAYGHTIGIVHQDMKPDNVMCTKARIYKVTDFGLATVPSIAADTDGSASRIGRKVKTDNESGTDSNRNSAPFAGGTKGYWSPEQAHCHALLSQASSEAEYEQLMETCIITQQADIYSFGATILHAYIGKRTWGSKGEKGAQGLMADIVQKDPRIPTMPYLEEVLKGCLEISLEKRYKTMQEVADILLGVYEREVGTKYPKRQPKSNNNEAYSLNNRALSAMELSNEAEAVALWEAAAESDSTHLETQYNINVYRWQRSQQTDVETIIALLNLKQTAKYKALSGYIDVARGQWEMGLWKLREAAMALENGILLDDVTRWIRIIGEVIDSHPIKRLEWELAGKRSANEQTRTEPSSAIMVSADEKALLAVSANGSAASLVDIQLGKSVSTVSLDGSSVYSVTLDPSNRFGIVTDCEGVSRFFSFYSTKSPEGLPQFDAKWCRLVNDRTVLAVVAQPLALAVSLYSFETVFDDEYTIDIRNFREIRTFTIQRHCDIFALSADGRVLVAGSESAGAACLLQINVESGAVTYEYDLGDMKSVTAVAVCATGTVIAAVCQRSNGTGLVVFNGRQRVDLFTKEPIISIELSSDGVRLLSAGKYLRAWDLRSTKCIQLLQVESLEMIALAPSGRFGFYTNNSSSTINAYRWPEPQLTAICNCVELSDMREILSQESVDREEQFVTQIEEAEMYMQKQEYLSALAVVRKARSIVTMDIREEGLMIWMDLCKVCTRVLPRARWRRRIHIVSGMVRGLCVDDKRQRLYAAGDENLYEFELASGTELKPEPIPLSDKSSQVYLSIHPTDSTLYAFAVSSAGNIHCYRRSDSGWSVLFECPGISNSNSETILAHKIKFTRDGSVAIISNTEEGFLFDLERNKPEQDAFQTKNRFDYAVEIQDVTSNGLFGVGPLTIISIYGIPVVKLGSASTAHMGGLVAISPDDESVARSDMHGGLTMFRVDLSHATNSYGIGHRDVPCPEPIFTVSSKDGPAHTSEVKFMSFSNDNKLLVTCAGSDAKVWNTENGDLILELSTIAPITSYASDIECQRVFFGLSNGTVEEWFLEWELEAKLNL